MFRTLFGDQQAQAMGGVALVEIGQRRLLLDAGGAPPCGRDHEEQLCRVRLPGREAQPPCTMDVP